MGWTGCKLTQPHPTMARIFLALFLIIFGLNITFGTSIPNWVPGILALISGILYLAESVGISFSKKP